RRSTSAFTVQLELGPTMDTTPVAESPTMTAPSGGTCEITVPPPEMLKLPEARLPIESCLVLRVLPLPTERLDPNGPVSASMVSAEVNSNVPLVQVKRDGLPLVLSDGSVSAPPLSAMELPLTSTTRTAPLDVR